MPAFEKLEGKEKAWSTHVLIVGDGFGSGEITSPGGLRDAAKAVGKAIAKQPWYPASKSLCVWFAPTPVDPKIHKAKLKYKCGGGAPPLPYVRFGAKYGTGAKCSMLKGDAYKIHDLVFDLEAQGLPDIRSTLVLVNYSAYGGYGDSQITWASLTPGVFIDLALHELGHAFGLYDEYENACGKPDAAATAINGRNITSNAKSPLWFGEAKPKPLQVATKVKPVDCDIDPKNPPIAVGSFPGGLYRHTKYFRPSEKCKMRDIADPFCAVCSNAIAATV